MYIWALDEAKKKKVSVSLETFSFSLSKQMTLFLENNSSQGRREGGYQVSVERQYILCQNGIVFNELEEIITCSLISAFENL